MAGILYTPNLGGLQTSYRGKIKDCPVGKPRKQEVPFISESH